MIFDIKNENELYLGGEERGEMYFSASFLLLLKIDGGLYFLFNKSKLRQININHPTLIWKTGVNSEIFENFRKTVLSRHHGFIKKIFCLLFVI